jgi:hypothetical protein
MVIKGRGVASCNASAILIKRFVGEGGCERIIRRVVALTSSRRAAVELLSS